MSSQVGCNFINIPFFFRNLELHFLNFFRNPAQWLPQSLLCPTEAKVEVFTISPITNTCTITIVQPTPDRTIVPNDDGPKSELFITPRALTFGGLGNQMFRYASLLGIASAQGLTFFVPPDSDLERTFKIRHVSSRKVQQT